MASPRYIGLPIRKHSRWNKGYFKGGIPRYDACRDEYCFNINLQRHVPRRALSRSRPKTGRLDSKSVSVSVRSHHSVPRRTKKTHVDEDHLNL